MQTEEDELGYCYNENQELLMHPIKNEVCGTYADEVDSWNGFVMKSEKGSDDINLSQEFGRTEPSLLQFLDIF